MNAILVRCAATLAELQAHTAIMARRRQRIDPCR
jgi:hypothetical protein